MVYREALSALVLRRRLALRAAPAPRPRIKSELGSGTGVPPELDGEPPDVEEPPELDVEVDVEVVPPEVLVVVGDPPDVELVDPPLDVEL